MPKALYVVSVEAGDGKTAIGAALARRWQQAGKRVEYLKPVSLLEPATKTPIPDDAFHFAREALGLKTPSPDPILVSTDRLGESAIAEIRDEVLSRCQGALDSSDVLVVEASGGLASSGLAREVAKATVQALKAKALLVAAYTRGMAPGPVLSSADLLGEAVIGVVVNKVPKLCSRAASESLASSITKAGIQVLGLIPESRTMFGISVRELITRLKGRYALETTRADELVENVMVGANVLDAPGYPAGPIYYGRKADKAVIAKGDRPDFQWAALDTATHCVILTGNHQPIPYVIEKAKERKIPVAVVEQDTLGTLEALEKILAAPRLDQKVKLERFQALVEENLDLGPLDWMIKA